MVIGVQQVGFACGLQGVAGGLLALAANPNVSRKFKKSGECSDFLQNFCFPAEDWVFSREILFSGSFLNFPAEFLNSRRTISRSAGNLDFLLENLFSSGLFNLPQIFQISGGGLDLSLENLFSGRFLDLPAEF